MTAWSVIVRGIRYRPGRSLVVALLVMLAVATAVAVPAYTRASQQSVLTDVLAAEPRFQIGVTGRSAMVDMAVTQATTRDLVAARPELARRLGEPVTAVELEMAVPGEKEATRLPVVWRGDACRHLAVVAGACPQGPRQVLLSERAAGQLRRTVGQEVPFLVLVPSGLGRTTAPGMNAVISGLYDPTRNLQDDFWGSGAYFGSGYDATRGIRTLDSAFMAEPAPLTGLGPLPTVSVEYPLRVADVRLADVPALRAALAGATVAGTEADVSIESALPQALDRAVGQQRALSRSVPLVALPLVLLCLFVLFAVAAAVTEERGPEIALGRLRGLRPGQLGGFGVGEPLLLTALAAPFGVALGLLVTEAAARWFLAGPVGAEPTPAVPLAAVAAVLAAAAAVALAGRRVVRTGVLT
ncbi:FtsX-like permease family protein, partial [Rhizomonospora bruguierae]|uniref:FtsX-like permease family protein n=1 Tax=Rhizomonospora bruguierae TaxID=1581705 RepID=UPI001BCA9A11